MKNKLIRSFGIFIIAYLVALTLFLYGYFSDVYKYIRLGISLALFLIPAVIGTLIRYKKQNNKKQERKQPG
jgi:uncharacterized membrane protein YqjE